MERLKRRWTQVLLAGCLVLGCAEAVSAEKSPYDRLALLDVGDAPRTRALLVVDVEAENPEMQTLAQGEFESGIPCVAKGTAFFLDAGGLCFTDLGSGEVRHAKLTGFPEAGELGAGRVFLMTQSADLQAIDVASRSSRSTALPDLSRLNPGLRLQPSPNGRRVAFCVQQIEPPDPSGIGVIKPDYDLLVVDVEVGRVIATTVLTWFDSSIQSVLGRGPEIVWMDDVTVLTLHRPGHEAAPRALRMNVETGGVQEGPELAAAADGAGMMRISSVPGTTPPLVLVKGAGLDFVLDVNTGKILDVADAPGFYLTRLTGGSEVRHNGKVIDSESGPSCLKGLTVSPDGQRAAWSAEVHSFGELELRCYDATEGKVRALGTLGPNSSRYVWLRSAELSPPATPHEPPTGWKPLELE